MLSLLLAAVLAAPPPYVDGYVGRRFDVVGYFTGYVVSRRVDVYHDPVTLRLLGTTDVQDEILELRVGLGVRVTGRPDRRPGASAWVVESVAPAEFPEFP